MGVLFNSGGAQTLPGSMSYDAARIVLTGDTNNLVIGNFNCAELNAQVACNLTGIKGGTDGKCYRLYNPNSNTVTLKNNTTSAVGNRFLFSADVLLTQNEAIDIQFSNTSNGWLEIGGTPGAGLGSVTSVSVTTANGFSGSVATPTTTPAISLSLNTSNTQVVFNDATAAGGDPDFTWNKASNTLSLGSVTTPSTIATPNGNNSNGADLNVILGNFNVAGTGGNFTLQTGDGQDAGSVGVLTLMLGSLGNTQINVSSTGILFNGNTSGAYTYDFQNINAANTAVSRIRLENDLGLDLFLDYYSSTHAGAILTNGPTGVGSAIYNLDALPLVFGSHGIASFVLGGTSGSANMVGLAGEGSTSGSYQTPATGFTITMADNIKFLTLNPAGTLATGTINLPTTPFDGQEIEVSSTQIITALTVNAAGKTIKNAPTTIAIAGSGFSYRYQLSSTTWFRRY